MNGQDELKQKLEITVDLIDTYDKEKISIEISHNLVLITFECSVEVSIYGSFLNSISEILEINVNDINITVSPFHTDFLSVAIACKLA